MDGTEKYAMGEAELIDLAEPAAAIAGPGAVPSLRGRFASNFRGARHVAHPVSVWAGIFVFVFGSLGYPLLPVIVGALSENLHFTITQVGAIASGEMSGMFLSAALALLWIRRVDWRWTAFGACVALVLCHVLSGQVTSFQALLAMRFLAGFFGGSMMALGATVVGDSDNPEGNVALLNVAQTALCALGFVIMPPLIEAYGASGAFLFLAIYVLPALPIAFLLPKAGRWPLPAAAAATTAPRQKGAVPMLLFATFPAFLFFCGYAASWAYIERIGVTAGLSHAQVGHVLSVSLMAGAAGSLLAWFLGLRFGRIIPTLITLVCQLASLAVLFWFLNGPIAYLIALMVFVFFVNFPSPYQVGLAVHADTTGRAAVLYLLMLKAGIAVAPYLAATFVTGKDFHGPLVMGGILFTISFLNFWAAEILTRRRAKQGAAQSI